jgi:hypothetical protein
LGGSPVGALGRTCNPEDDQIIILGRNGNAFLVPARAFISIEEKRAFLSFVQSALVIAASRIRK